MAFYYIQAKNKRIELLSKEGVWTFQALGVEWQFPESMERFVLYYLFADKNYIQVKETFRLYESMSDPEAQRMIDIIRKKYQIEDYTWNWEDITPYACEKYSLILPNPFGYEFSICRNEEESLIELARDSKPSVIDCFDKMLNERQLCSKKNGFLSEAEQLTYSFFIQHGIKPFSKSAGK